MSTTNSTTSHQPERTQHEHTNRLAGETSPYLLQHAHNPVDWYPWGEEALSAATARDVPIFLSIGYAACHWCHVMERESFEDEQTAADLNEHFVAIKVDREERPDLDSIYMDAVQAMTRQGGWPMSVFLTPDGRPFYGGTYFPDEPRHGMPSFRQLLARITELWKTQRDEIEQSASHVAEHVRGEQDAPARLADQMAAQMADQMAEGIAGQMGAKITGEPRPDPTVVLRGAVDTLRKNFDAIDGGWGGAPKFPQPMTLELLLREHLRTVARDPLTMVEKTLDAMAAGGIYDHLDGGFARYATDKAWLVPHFEKMLYDNAQLARVYTHSAQITGNDHYAYVARETLDFVAHQLRNPPAGAFASSLDADTEGREGLSYVWQAAQIHEILGEVAPLFASAYGVTPHGNWEGHTILHRVRSDADLAVEFDRPRDDVREALAEARVKLLRARDERPQPMRDDKVLTSWNGLMMGAFADAGIALTEPAFVDIAREAADFILANLRTADGRLRRSWKDGRAQHAATLEDYAHLAEGLLTLYESTFDERYFNACRELAEVILDHFRADDGGFHDTADDAEILFARPRNVQDNAIPSGGAMATTMLLQLAALTGEGRYRSAAEAALPPIITLAAKHPSGLAQWLIAYQLASTPIDEVAIVGDAESDDTKALLAAARGRYRPGQVLALTSDPATSDVPLLHDRSAINGAATAYVCRGFACRQPTTDPTELTGQLQDTPAS